MSLADLSRRLGVSYDDLAAIVTHPVHQPRRRANPAADPAERLLRHHQGLHDNLGTAADITASFIASLPAGLDATQYGGASPGDYTAVVSWVTGADVYPRIMDIITITAPADGAADCSGVDLFLRYANPDTTANALTAADYPGSSASSGCGASSRRCSPTPPARHRSSTPTTSSRPCCPPARPRQRPGSRCCCNGSGSCCGSWGSCHCPAARHCPGCSPASRRSGPRRSPARTRSTRTCSSPPRCCSRTRRSRTTATATTSPTPARRCSPTSPPCARRAASPARSSPSSPGRSASAPPRR